MSVCCGEMLIVCEEMNIEAKELTIYCNEMSFFCREIVTVSEKMKVDGQGMGIIPKKRTVCGRERRSGCQNPSFQTLSEASR